MNARRAVEREIGHLIPDCHNPQRREACRNDWPLALRTYFPHRFTRPFTANQLTIIESILPLVKYGGDQSIGAPRGDGKTSIAIGCLILGAMYGQLPFTVLVSANTNDAIQILDNIKNELESNETLLEDFPQVCMPIRLLDRSASRARKQLCGGKYTSMYWGQKRITLPTIEGSPASGCHILTRGLDAAIRGMLIGSQRPTLIMLDDPETAESARSDEQIAKREQILDRDIGCLAGPGVQLARLALVTLSNRRCLAYRLTDPAIRPSWNGWRFALVESKPDRADLWEQYITMRRKGQEDRTDKHGRAAHRFYLENQETMDRGAKVSNPSRHSEQVLQDGSLLQVSTLQYFYDFVAQNGEEAAETELNNNPSPDETPESIGITPTLIQHRLNNRPRGIGPDDSLAVTCGVDIGKYYLHYVAMAWQQDGSGSVLDYDVEPVHSSQNLPETVAISQALASLSEKLVAGYQTTTGRDLLPSCILVDSGYWDTTIIKFTRAQVGNIFRPSKGFGSGRGMTSFHHGKKSSTRLPGDHWCAVRQSTGAWLWELDTDHWKRYVHDRFMSAVDRPGGLSIWGDEIRAHYQYAKHLTAEIEKEEFVPGKGMRRFWDKVSGQNHWFDATYMACAAASMLRMFGDHAFQRPRVAAGAAAIAQVPAQDTQAPPGRRNFRKISEVRRIARRRD